MINEITQNTLNSLTSLSLAKAYYSMFQPDHCGFWCYGCHLQHMVLNTVMDRGGNSKYLNGQLTLDNFEEDKLPYRFYEKWLRKNSL